MTDRTLFIHVESHKAFVARTIRAAQAIDRGEDVLENEHLSFTDLRTYLSTLTPKRLELVAKLKEAGTMSIRALAKASCRDYKSVHQDVTKLLELGLLQKDADGCLAAPYDRIVSEISWGSTSDPKSTGLAA